MKEYFEDSSSWQRDSKVDLVFEKPVKGRLTGSLYEQERIPAPAVKFEDELFLSVGELSQPKPSKF